MYQEWNILKVMDNILKCGIDIIPTVIRPIYYIQKVGTLIVKLISLNILQAHIQ